MSQRPKSWKNKTWTQFLSKKKNYVVKDSVLEQMINPFNKCGKILQGMEDIRVSTKSYIWKGWKPWSMKYRFFSQIRPQGKYSSHTSGHLAYSSFLHIISGINFCFPLSSVFKGERVKISLQIKVPSKICKANSLFYPYSLWESSCHCLK